ncbi:MAG: transporter [Planctomycetaceae bacterium]|nr:transporter [Planctomycetaceae bacterium]
MHTNQKGHGEQEHAIVSPYAPLRRRMFFWLWAAALTSNIGTWLQNVAAAWLMTSLNPSPFLVAMVQAVTTLPVFLLALPAGALADIVDRRRLLLAAQLWMLVAAGALAVLTHNGMVTPSFLLLLTMALGAGFALNAPAWQAVIPDLVPRAEVSAAVALNGVSVNISRAVGPAIGGALVAAFGAEAAFLLNALSFIGVVVVLALWRNPVHNTPLPAERLWGAMWAGVRYVRHAPDFRLVLWRVTAFVTSASALLALLPAASRLKFGDEATAYGLLLGCMGVGAVGGTLLLPSFQKRISAGALIAIGSAIYAGGTIVVAYVASFPAWCAAMIFVGAAWLILLTILSSASQALLPRWVRARALAVYILALYGGMAAGSAFWGAIADRIGISNALALASVSTIVGSIVTARFRLPTGLENFEPSGHWPDAPPVSVLQYDNGPVLVIVEYRIDSSHEAEFRRVLGDLREIRLRDGALRWDLFSNAERPECFVEVFLVESWIEHLRQHERVTVADQAVQERAKQLIVGPDLPRVTHLISQSNVR